MIILALALASLCSPAPPPNPEQILNDPRRLALQGSLTGGDMMISPELLRNGIKDVRFRWPGYPGAARIPYVIDPSVNLYRANITAAMKQYHDNTCIRFIARTTEKQYIKITALSGCWAHVGRDTREKMPLLLSLGQGCGPIGTIVHELGHVVGFYHEQNRSDRGKYLTIYKQNVDPNKWGNFFELDKKDESIFNSFDYESIMIYGNYAFTNNGKKTMEAINGHPLTDPYDKKGLNRSDIQRIKQLYKCK